MCVVRMRVFVVVRSGGGGVGGGGLARRARVCVLKARRSSSAPQSEGLAQGRTAIACR